ncbi:MAG: hypothetical protein ACI9T7_000962 [Oleiphilaceae bacterium]|jgi:hypothetical protein
MHNNIGGSNFLSSDGHDLLRKKSSDNFHSHGGDMASKMVSEESTGNVSFFAAKAEFFSASITKDGGYKILAQALSIEFSSTTNDTSLLSSSSSSSSMLSFSESFKPPSPLDVANKVLGFIENRLNSELEAGAGGERISSLISQAREGVQKGFSQAKDDIESLGLMTEKLDKDIGKGFDRIDDGLIEMEGRYAGVLSSDELEGVDVEPGSTYQGVDVSGRQVLQEVTTDFGSVAMPVVDGVVVADSISSRSTYMNSSEFSLKTQGGDTITIRYADTGSEVFESAGNNLLLEQSQFQGYQLEVNGELDEAELAAITDLFAQLGEVSSLFFSGNFQDAFASALDVGFDASEIASFSLDLAKVQTQEVRTYSNPGDVYEQSAVELGAIQKNQPLIEMTSLFEKSLELLKSFDDQQFDFRKLVMESLSMETVEKGEVSKVSQNDFSDFMGKLLEQLTE